MTLIPLHAIASVLGLLLLSVALFRLLRADPVLRTRRLAALAGCLMMAPFALGCTIYPHYRTEVKPGLLVDYPALAAAFESKEHLAAMGVCCVLGGAGALLSTDPPGLRAARSMLGAGWLLCMCSAVIGVAVTWGPSLMALVAGP